MYFFFFKWSVVGLQFCILSMCAAKRFNYIYILSNSVAQSCPILWPHGPMQHARPLCPSPTPGVYSSPLNLWCHPTISSSVSPFPSCPQSFPASGAPLVAQTVKNLPGVQEICIRFLGQEASPGEQNGNPLQYSCMENSMDRGVWRATVHEVTESDTTEGLTLLTLKSC